LPLGGVRSVGAARCGSVLSDCLSLLPVWCCSCMGCPFTTPLLTFTSPLLLFTLPPFRLWRWWCLYEPMDHFVEMGVFGIGLKFKAVLSFFFRHARKKIDVSFVHVRNSQGSQ